MSMWLAMSSGVASCWSRVLTVIWRPPVKPGVTESGFVYLASFSVHSWNPSTSGNATTLRPFRTRSLSLSCDLPPVASQRYLGIRPAQMTAVFSLSTRATGLSGYSARRCSPKRHWVSCQSSGSCPEVFIRECTQVIRPGVFGSLMRWPVSGSYFIILPVRHRPSLSIWKKIVARLRLTPMRYSSTRPSITTGSRKVRRKVIRSESWLWVTLRRTMSSGMVQSGALTRRFTSACSSSCQDLPPRASGWSRKYCLGV